MREPNGRAALAFAVAWFVLCACAVTYAQATLWDLRVFRTDPIDSSWRIELAWRAWRGDWSGRDFHYPRGPLWQVVGWVAAGLSGGDIRWTHALLALGFQLASLALVAGIVCKTVREPWARTAAFVACAIMTAGSGADTFRGFLPTVVILAYAPRDDDSEPHPWRRASFAAGATVLSALVSLDRLYVIGLGAISMACVEIVIRAWQRRSPGRAIVRALRYAGVLALLSVLVALCAYGLGADPIEAVLAQRRIGEAYGVSMATEWQAAVSRANPIALLIACAALVILPRLSRESRAPITNAMWLAGAIPAMVFVLVRADQSHLFLSMTPAIVMLVLIAAKATPQASSAVRAAAGILAAIALLGWFGTYPRGLAGHPRALMDAISAATGKLTPDRDFTTDHGAAIAWARTHVDRRRCLAVSADYTILHPILDVPGPTTLSLRWSDEMQRALAERIESARCPHFIYSVRNLDYPGEAWPFGADFVAIARRYAPIERIGGGVIAMRLREHERSIHRIRVAGASSAMLQVPGEHRIPLDEPVRGTDLLELSLRIDFSRWRSFAGGTPLVEWRAENAGKAQTDWKPVYNVSVAKPTAAQLAVQPEAAEWYWTLGTKPAFERTADAIAFRSSSRGVFSPKTFGVTVSRIDRLRIEPDPPPARPSCEPEIDLLARMLDGRAFLRQVSPRISITETTFDLEPSPANQHLAEVLIPIVPCAESCFSAAFELLPGMSDGAEAEVHVLEVPERALLARVHLPPDGRTVPVELSLERWAGREVILRLGSLPGPSWGKDFVKVFRPRIARCSARTMIASALAAGRARVARGKAEVRAQDVVFGGSGGGELRLPMTPVANTCVRFGIDALGASGSVIHSFRVGDGDVQHVLSEQMAEAARGVGEPGEHSLFDFTGRSVELIFEVTPGRPSSALPGALIAPRVYACGADPMDDSRSAR